MDKINFLRRNTSEGIKVVSFTFDPWQGLMQALKHGEQLYIKLYFPDRKRKPKNSGWSIRYEPIQTKSDFERFTAEISPRNIGGFFAFGNNSKIIQRREVIGAYDNGSSVSRPVEDLIIMAESLEAALRKKNPNARVRAEDLSAEIRDF